MAVLASSLELTNLKQPTFPDYKQNYIKTIVEPCTNQGGHLEGYSCIVPPPPPVLLPAPVEVAYVAPPPVVPIDELTGSIGIAIAGGNCVLEVPLSIRPDGNPITWLATTQTPYIGGVALFTYNHVGIITGVWSNGDLEIRHQNWNGMPVTRFPRSAMRGFR